VRIEAVRGNRSRQVKAVNRKKAVNRNGYFNTEVSKTSLTSSFLNDIPGFQDFFPKLS
jgi:hypothetical protein